MQADAGGWRRLAALAAGLGAGAFLIRLLTLPLTGGTRAAAAVLGVAAMGVLALVWLAPPYPARARGVLAVTGALAAALLAGLALRIAAPVLPEYPMTATAVYAALIVGVDATAPLPAAAAAVAATIAVFAELWFTTVALRAGTAGGFATAAALLVALGAAALAQAARASRALDGEQREARAYAALARHLGSEHDVPAVVAAVLAASAELFPEATQAALYLRDEDGVLRTPAGVPSQAGAASAAAAQLELAEGEGLGGLAASTGGGRVWPTALSVSAAEATLRESNRSRLREAGATYPRCAIGAPIRTASAVLGCIVLGSDRRERVWGSADVPLLEAVAAETARAIERSRRHAAALDQALTDSITGLATHRQLVMVVEKEVARAARAETTLAVIFSDLDGFKEINDAWGHDAGNRILAMYAEVLRATLRREDTAARYGGDEFVCVLPGADREQAQAVAERISHAFAEASAGDPVSGGSAATASHGIAVYPHDAETAEAVLRAADAELIAVKQRERRLPGRRRRLRRREGAEREKLV